MSLESILKNIDLSNKGIEQLESQMKIQGDLINELKNSPNISESDKARIRSIEAYSKNAFAKAGKQDMSFQDVLEKMKNL